MGAGGGGEMTPGGAGQGNRQGLESRPRPHLAGTRAPHTIYLHRDALPTGPGGPVRAQAACWLAKTILQAAPAGDLCCLRCDRQPKSTTTCLVSARPHKTWPDTCSPEAGRLADNAQAGRRSQPSDVSLLCPYLFCFKSPAQPSSSLTCPVWLVFGRLIRRGEEEEAGPDVVIRSRQLTCKEAHVIRRPVRFASLPALAFALPVLSAPSPD
jgi:hypothetical protein